MLNPTLPTDQTHAWPVRLNADRSMVLSTEGDAFRQQLAGKTVAEGVARSRGSCLGAPATAAPEDDLPEENPPSAPFPADCETMAWAMPGVVQTDRAGERALATDATDTVPSFAWGGTTRHPSHPVNKATIPVVSFVSVTGSGSVDSGNKSQVFATLGGVGPILPDPTVQADKLAGSRLVPSEVRMTAAAAPAMIPSSLAGLTRSDQTPSSIATSLAQLVITSHGQNQRNQHKSDGAIVERAAAQSRTRVLPALPTVSTDVTVQGLLPAQEGGAAFLGSAVFDAVHSSAGNHPDGTGFNTQFAAPVASAAPGSLPALDLPIAQGSALQLARAIAGATGDQVEITLAPEELGKVRIHLHQSELGLQVLIATERAETLDLLRKNITLLSRALQELGYESANFQFQDQGRGREAPQELSKTRAGLDPSSMPSGDMPAPIGNQSIRGLDLRV